MTSIETDRTSDLVSPEQRAAIVADVLGEQLTGMAAQIPEPALAGPLGFFGRALRWSAHAAGSPGRREAELARLAELDAESRAILADSASAPTGSAGDDLNATVEALVLAAGEGVAGAAGQLGRVLGAVREIEEGATAGGGADAAPAGPPAADAGRAQAYLRSRFGDAGAEVHDLTVVGGGYSKFTILITATIGGERQEIVLRQLPAGRPNDLEEEFGMLRHVWAPGRPIAEPLWLEPADNELGGPFFASRRLPGTNLGTVSGASGAVPATFCEDLADYLAQLHALDTAGIGATPVPPMRTPAEIRAAIDEMAGKGLAAGGGSLDPRTTAIVTWLRANVPPEGRPVAIVHGDVGLHNSLVHEDRLSALLDWERSHLGDPVEDLAYLRPSLEPVYPWSQFVDRYVAAGGTAPDADAERFYTVWQDTWRHIECTVMAALFPTTRGVPMMIAGYVLGPEFLASALRTAFGDPAATDDAGVTS